MDNLKRRLMGAALAAAAYFTMGQARGGAPPLPPAQAGFETRCAVVDATTVEGYVTNNGPIVIQVAGPVRFSFTVDNSMSRPTAQVQSAVVVPPGRTVRVARAQMAGSFLPSEVCQLDVNDAVRY
jgi:hypothetical protein